MNSLYECSCKQRYKSHKTDDNIIHSNQRKKKISEIPLKYRIVHLILNYSTAPNKKKSSLHRIAEYKTHSENRPNTEQLPNIRYIHSFNDWNRRRRRNESGSYKPTPVLARSGTTRFSFDEKKNENREKQINDIAGNVVSRARLVLSSDLRPSLVRFRVRDSHEINEKY